MSIEDKIKIYKEYSKRIEDLEVLKKTLGQEILAMMPKELKIKEQIVLKGY